METTINAPASVVWKLVKDVNNWSKWNPIMSARTHTGSEVVENKKFDLFVQASPNLPAQKFIPTVDLYSEERGVQWTGHAGNLDFSGIADGTHYILLEKIDEGTTRLIHGERFSGVLIFLLKLIINFVLLPRIRAAYVKFNLALKAEAEKQVK